MHSATKADRRKAEWTYRRLDNGYISVIHPMGIECYRICGNAERGWRVMPTASQRDPSRKAYPTAARAAAAYFNSAVARAVAALEG